MFLQDTAATDSCTSRYICSNSSEGDALPTNTRAWTQGFQKPGNVHFEPAAYTAMATFIYSSITNSSSSTHVMS